MIRLRHLLTTTLLLCLAFAKAQEVTFSTKGGFYDKPFELTLSCAMQNKVIHYTTNGNVPKADDPTYQTPLWLDEHLFSKSDIYTIRNCPDKDWFLPESVQKCIVIRAAVFDETGTRLSEVATQTYLIKSIGCDTHSLPVLSICADSLDLFDDEYGIFVPGKNYHEWNPDYSGNYYQEGRDWERECNFEFIEPNNDGINQKAGIRIQGNGSRRFSQKGLKFYAREEYGNKRFLYKFFNELENDRFKHLRIKPFNSGYENLGCQDYICNLIARDTRTDCLASRPLLLFLNGEYWGIYYLQEKPDEKYLEDHYDADLDRLNIIGNWKGLCEYGDNTSFLQLYDWMESHDLSQDDNYTLAASQIDIDNFIDYQILELFIANTDWPANNMRCWQEGEGLWRWIYFDGDACLIRPNFDVFANATYDSEGNYYMTNARSTLFFRKLMENMSFRMQFCSRFLQLMEGPFSYTHTKHYYDQTLRLIDNEISKQSDRFGNPVSYEEWSHQMVKIDDFLSQRCVEIRRMLEQYTNEDQCVSIEEIYPNPAQDHIHVILTSDGISFEDLHVFDVMGHQLMHSTHCIGNGRNEIEIPIALQNGVYFMRIGDTTRKFVVMNSG